MNIEAIQDGLKKGYYKNNPHLCADTKAEVAGHLSWVYGQLERLAVERARWFNSNRKDYKSDTACHRAFETTTEGIDLAGLEYREKALKTIITAMNSLIAIANNESKNNY